MGKNGKLKVVIIGGGLVRPFLLKLKTSWCWFLDFNTRLGPYVLHLWPKRGTKLTCMNKETVSKEIVLNYTGWHSSLRSVRSYLTKQVGEKSLIQSLFFHWNVLPRKNNFVNTVLFVRSNNFLCYFGLPLVIAGHLLTIYVTYSLHTVK